MKEIKIAAIGEILFDVFGEIKKPGGSSLNVSLHLIKQGIETNFISALGEDKNAKELLQYLDMQNLPTQYIQKSVFATSTVTVKLDEQKQASYTINQPVAWDDIHLNDDLIKLVKAADAFIYCSLTCRNETSKRTIFELLNYANLKIFDINLRAPHFNIETLKYLLAKADILKINEEELSYLCSELLLPKEENKALETLQENFNLQLICLTLGNKGAKVFYNKEFFKHSGYAVVVADTVGAGDSFLATFIAGFLKKLPIQNNLDLACKVAAFVASQTGANPDYPKNILNN